ncbi:hypothetical protein RIEGSTA812A_PEG_303 [invertebrate metagenome]|uniref:Uncharacterized protein n=1 Tax=invertebrate metagenome TaxID=1711999 RepID=A0A484H619_9ZZZZ
MVENEHSTALRSIKAFFATRVMPLSPEQDPTRKRQAAL